MRNLKKQLEKIYRKAALKLVRMGVEVAPAAPPQQEAAPAAAAAAAAGTPPDAAPAAEGSGGEQQQQQQAAEQQQQAEQHVVEHEGSRTAQIAASAEGAAATAMTEPLIVIDAGGWVGCLAGPRVRLCGPFWVDAWGGSMVVGNASSGGAQRRRAPTVVQLLAPLAASTWLPLSLHPFVRTSLPFLIIRPPICPPSHWRPHLPPKSLAGDPKESVGQLPSSARPTPTLSCPPSPLHASPLACLPVQAI